jgi:hypothetical protein
MGQAAGLPLIFRISYAVAGYTTEENDKWLCRAKTWRAGFLLIPLPCGGRSGIFRPGGEVIENFHLDVYLRPTRGQLE